MLKDRVITSNLDIGDPDKESPDKIYDITTCRM